MKKLLFILIMLASAGAFGQSQKINDTIYTGVDTLKWYHFYSRGGWSAQLDYQLADTTTATLGFYWTNSHPDSAIYTLLEYDFDKDGSNDNPYTLSDTTNMYLGKFGVLFPAEWLVIRFTGNGVSDSLKLPIKIVKDY